MAYSGNGSITSTVNLSGLHNQAVNAYPFIFYGGDPYGDQIGDQPPQFPAQLNSMSSLIFDVTYALTGTPAGDIDVLFDQYLIPSSTYSGGLGGVLEVEVLPYFNFADGQACSFVKTFKEPITINGTVTNVAFSENSCGPGAGSDILFYPPGNGYPADEIRFNMLDFANEAASTAGLSSSWWLAGLSWEPSLAIARSRTLRSM